MTRVVTHRLFFALWPTDTVRAQIIRQFKQAPQSRVSARTMRNHNLHMTLHFIGNVDAATRDCMHHAAQQIAFESFRLTLDYFGHFYRARVFWLGCHRVPEALHHLYGLLGESLQSCGYAADHRPFSPHVTLMRKLVKPGEIIKPEPIDWLVDEFVLVESVPVDGGVDYQVIERYGLGVE